MTVKFNFTRKSLVLLSFSLMLPITSSHAHSGSPLGVAWLTCDGKPKSQACEYKGFHGERYIGTCQAMANSMLCVRNQPIEYPEKASTDATEVHTEEVKEIAEIVVEKSEKEATTESISEDSLD